MSKTNNESKEKGKTKGPGHFQFPYHRVPAIAEQNLGPDALATYIVHCSGVDSTKTNLSRACTHGAQSVSLRTTLPEPRAARAILTLKKAGFLQCANSCVSMNDLSSAKPNMVQCLVDPSYPCDMSISHEFVQPANRDDPKRPICNPGTLAHLIENIDIVEGIDKGSAIVDALLTYLTLHKAHDFDLYGGVDPNAIHGRFTPSQYDLDGNQFSFRKGIEGYSDWTSFTMDEPSIMSIAPEFSRETLGMVQVGDNSPSTDERMKHAIKQLAQAGLIYKAHVLWGSDPISRKPGKHPDPLYTLYVGSYRDPLRELFLQKEVNNVLWATDTVDRTDEFKESRGLSPNFAHSGKFRYIVPNSQADEAILLMQYRPRRWAGNRAMCSSLSSDALRVENWKNRFSSLMRCE